MSLKEQLNYDVAQALRAGDVLSRLVLGLVLAAIHNKEIEKHKQESGLTDEEIIEVLAAEAKKRKDALESFQKAARLDLADKEERELEIIKKYLPREASPDEVRTVLERVIAAAGTKSKNDFGRLMGLAVKELKNRASGQTIKNILDGLLE